MTMMVMLLLMEMTTMGTDRKEMLEMNMMLFNLLLLPQQ